MRDLDLKMEPEGEPRPAEVSAAPTSNVVVKTGAVSDAHETLLKDIDGVRGAAQAMRDCVEALSVMLLPKQEELELQAQMQADVIRQALAGMEREWAQTATRYRTLVDDLSRQAAWQEARVAKASSPSRILIAAFLGGLLGAILTAVLISAIERVRTSDSVAPAPIVVSDPAAKPKPPAKIPR
jgi:hypothetical protein